MPQHTLIIILLIQAATVAAVMVILIALRRWQRSVWLREQGKTAQGFEVNARGEEQPLWVP